MADILAVVQLVVLLLAVAAAGVGTWLSIRAAARARADLALSREIREEARAQSRLNSTAAQHILGPWSRLVEAIEEAPAGRLQITRQEIEAAPVLPAESAVDYYLNNRWPGLELWQSESAPDLGVIIEWRNRP